MTDNLQMIDELEMEDEILTDRQEVDEQSEKPQKSKTIYVPKVQNMDNYFLKHYKGYVLQELNKRLVEGEIDKIIGVPVKSEKIEAGECCFQRFNYWRINKSDFWIDIDLRIELRIETPAGIDTDFYWFFVELWFSFGDDEEECAFESMGRLEEKQEHEECWKLDKYLVPVLRRDEIDKYSEAMWEQYYPAAAKDQRLRNPRELAKKMGLSIINIRLYKRNHIKGIIFFRESTVLMQPERLPGEREEVPPQEITIPAMTIVLNSHADSTYDYGLDTYHECIHSDLHYLFYRLQDMHNNDTKELKLVKKTAVNDRDYSNPIEFMEKQARYGSYGLMMPITFMRETIERIYKDCLANKRKNGTFDHDGRRYEVVGRSIASDYMLSKARVRARMLQLGYSAARGSLNYVDGRYITPFAFSETENSSGNETYVIDRKTIAMLYQNDKKFRDIMQSGHFAYVDGHVVHCDSANLTRSCDGTRLSAWANAHIDRVSLRFSKVYTEDHKYVYTFGQMNSEEALKNSFKFLDMNGSMTIQEAERAKNKLMEEMPSSFHGALSYIMKGRMTVDELINRIPISRNTLLRLRTEDKKNYNLDQIVAICIGLNLPPWLSAILLEKAGLTVKRYGPYGYYGTILDCFYMDTIQEVQEFLQKNGYEQLMLNFN